MFSGIDDFFYDSIIKMFLIFLINLQKSRGAKFHNFSS